MGQFETSLTLGRKMPSFAWFRCLVLATVIASVQATFFNKLPSSTKSVAQTADRCFCEVIGVAHWFSLPTRLFLD